MWTQQRFSHNTVKKARIRHLASRMRGLRQDAEIIAFIGMVTIRANHVSIS